MSNSRHIPPKAAMNGQGQSRQATQTEILSVIAGGMQAMVQHLQSPMGTPQHMQCAVCLGLHRAWEESNAAEIQTVITNYQALIADYNARAAAGEPPQQMPPTLVQFLDGHFGVTDHPRPPVNEAATMASIPSLGGTCLVCPAHLPVMNLTSADRKGFLIANRPLSRALIAELGG